MVINDYAVREKGEKMSVLVAECFFCDDVLILNVMIQCADVIIS